MKESSRAFERKYSIKSISCLTLPFNTNKAAKLNIAVNLNKLSRTLCTAYSTLISAVPLDNKINPWFITGFVDAEGSFIIKVQPNNNLKTKWRVRAVFSITLHIKDLSLLETIQQTIGAGKISKNKLSAIYAVDSVKEIPIIINLFNKYPLVTHKLSDFLLFKQCFELIQKGEHLTETGLLEIISLKSSLNLGLPENLKTAFPDIIAKERPYFNFSGIPDSYWIAGFTTGDGSFHVAYRETNSKFSGILARFSIHLHRRELDILKGISIYLKNWKASGPEGAEGEQSPPDLGEKKITILENSVSLQITKFSDVINIVIPFFNQYPILGIKSLDFKDFKQICEILKTKEHLTSSSALNKIETIKSGMNLNRKW